MITPQTRQYALAILRQQQSLLQRIDSSVYAQPCSVLKGSVGQHIRHAVDHFRALLFLRSESPTDQNSQLVRYDDRQRGTDIETDPLHAQRAVQDCVDEVASLGSEDLRLQVEFMTNAAGEREVFESCLSRELAFVSHHAIHHHAMIKAIALLPSNGTCLVLCTCRSHVMCCLFLHFFFELWWLPCLAKCASFVGASFVRVVLDTHTAACVRAYIGRRLLGVQAWILLTS